MGSEPPPLPPPPPPPPLSAVWRALGAFFALSLSLHLLTLGCYLELRAELRRRDRPAGGAAREIHQPAAAAALQAEAGRPRPLEDTPTAPQREQVALRSLLFPEDPALPVSREESSIRLHHRVRRNKRSKASEGAEGESRAALAFLFLPPIVIIDTVVISKRLLKIRKATMSGLLLLLLLLLRVFELSTYEVKKEELPEQQLLREMSPLHLQAATCRKGTGRDGTSLGRSVGPLVEEVEAKEEPSEADASSRDRQGEEGSGEVIEIV
nr:PREDICTED: ectodysplasin-A [Anolis carolinensis]|eukprot:XP_008122028.1 PREDICTED: ectodysplasin-A [Anolis carolinensis]